MTTKYEQPILTRTLYVFGVLTIIGAVIGAVVCVVVLQSWSEAVVVGAGGLFSGIIYIGIGQGVDYLARTAHATDHLITAVESLAQRVESVETRLSPSSPLLVRVDTTPPPPAARTAFYYSIDGTRQGPLSAGEMRRLWGESVIRDDTPVLRDGESQWRTYGELLSLRKKSEDGTHVG